MVALWLCNPVFWGGIVLLGRRPRWCALGAALAGLLAVGMGNVFLWQFDPWIQSRLNLASGYYLWYASFCLLAFIGSLRAVRGLMSRRLIQEPG
jgi:hypothetical protein